MRILIANTIYPPHVVGGAELSVQGIAEQMASMGHTVAVLTTGICDENSELHGVTVYRRRFNGLMPYEVHRKAKRSPIKVANKALTIDNPINTRTILRVFDETRPDIVQSHNLLGITPELWRVARRLGVPVMHTTRDYSLLCPNSTLMCKARGLCGDSPRPVCRMMRLHHKRASRLVGLASAPSRYTLDLHLRNGFFDKAKTCVIPNAIKFDPKRVRDAAKRRQQDKRAEKLRIAYVGRVEAEKGVETLMQALQLCDKRQVELHVAGRGSLVSRLEEIASNGAPVVTHGFLDSQALDQLLCHCDVLVAPSIWPEPFGRVVLDAYAHAMPVIVSDAGALPEILAPGTGRVFNAGDAHGLAYAINEYIEHKEILEEQGRHGADALMGFTVERQAHAYLEQSEGLVRA